MVGSRGRPRLKVEEKDLRIIEDMSGRGARLSDIAIVIGVSDSTLDRWLKVPAVQTSYNRGRIVAKDAIAKTLYDMAMAGDVAACIFWLKAQAGWSDKPKAEMPAGSSVVFYIPENNSRNNPRD